ncbi:MAG TPA: hypothetical protein DIC36_04680 [Gammaproteobacteria bacterium]|nr:hypothetical protein [Gammaproteobacteria bacterium]
MKFLNMSWIQQHLVKGGNATLIADRMAWLVRLTATAFVVLGAVYVIANSIIAWDINVQGKLGTYALDASDFNVQLLQMRRAEKDFFDRRTQEELDKFAKAHQAAVAALNRARANSQTSSHEIELIDDTLGDVDNYSKAFLKAAETQRTLGYDENSGLQGTLRNAVHEVESAAKDVGSVGLIATMLQERRHEKDFILREDEEYHKAFKKDLAPFRTSAAKVDPQLLRLISAYEHAFDDFVTGTFARNKAVDNARETAHNAEEMVPQLVEDSVARQASANKRSLITLTIVALVLMAALWWVARLLRNSLGMVRTSLTRSVTALRDTVDKVRAGEQVSGEAAVVSEDEMGLVWKSVDALLQDRMAAQQKAEAENEQLNNSVISILQGMDSLSHRDLTARVPVSKDIIGTVSDSVNALADETAKVLNNVTGIARQVAEVSSRVRAQGEKVSLTAEDERKSVTDMFNSLGDATSSINRVAALAEQSNTAAERATDVTNTALTTVNETVRGMDSIRETISETEKRIKRLGERSQEISGIVNLINTISERTHVLALNASMQAAVAGEAGRGFAVVAEEVQRLAESSRNATQQIATLVNNIQIETNETIATVNRTIGQVVQGSEQAQKAGEQMQQTQQITQELVEQVRRIAHASNLQKEVSVNLLDAIQKLGGSNENTAQQIDAQFKETETLQDAAKKLVESVSVFKLPAMA